MMKRNAANPVPSLSSKQFSLKKGRAWFGLAALCAAIFLAIVFRVVDFFKTVSYSTSDRSVSAIDQDPISVLLTRVNRHVSLPAGAPSVEHVSQIAALKQVNPLFYQDLEDGDWILRYPSVLVVYRAEIDRVIRVKEVEPIGDVTSTTQP